mmetsp:Transcript_27689/g.26709  ORF Transcript_27689/g.26709 Transcript_27689/m.26709 type:complete len:158 (-) Transcript_27689:212-685(-)
MLLSFVGSFVLRDSSLLIVLLLLHLLLLLLDLELLLLLLLLQPVEKFVGHGQHLGQQVVIIKIFQIIAFLEHFVVIVGGSLDLHDEGFVEKVHLPVLLEVVYLVLELRILVLHLQGELGRRLGVLLASIGCGRNRSPHNPPSRQINSLSSEGTRDFW